MVSPRRARGSAPLAAIAVLLLAQFVLGMVVNLYVVVPRSHPGARAGNYLSGVVSGVSWAIRRGPWSLAVHAALGLALVIVALVYLLHTLRTRTRGALAPALLGAVLTIGAGFNGASFLDFGHAVSSLVMAVCSVLAFTAYLAGALRTPPREVLAYRMRRR
ncbi:MAG: hypothetical protein ACRDL5_18625 [Solirubrobacteraceae bacterium]